MMLKLNKREAKKLLKAIDGPSVDDPVLADLYYRIKYLIEEPPKRKANRIP